MTHLNLTPKLAIVVPCYNESNQIEQTAETLFSYLDDLKRQGEVDNDSFLLFVDDGSTDETFDILKRAKRENINLIKLSSNKGHQVAILAGLKHVACQVDCAISIDADLQDDFELIKEMLIKYRNGAHFVCGVKKNILHNAPLTKVACSLFFYWSMKKIGINLVSNHADFRLHSKFILQELDKYNESHIFLRGVVKLIKGDHEIVSYDLRKRMVGKSKYSARKMFSLFIQAVTSFSVIPLRIIFILGILLFFISMILSVRVLYVVYLGENIPGWASVTLPMYLIGGVQLLCIGVIGEYVGKIFGEVKKRPLYHIEEMHL